MHAMAASAPLLPAFTPGAINRLLHRVAGQHAEGRPGRRAVEGHLPDALGALAGDVLEVGRAAADDAAQRDHARVLAALGHPAHQPRQLEGARARGRRRCRLRHAVAHERVHARP